LVLIRGDFNVDIEGEGGSELAQVMAGAGLVDMYRVVEPDTPGYTWKNSRGHSSRPAVRGGHGEAADMPLDTFLGLRSLFGHGWCSGG
ncbi:hypothetical protein DAT39_021374, partial [Clarias magur]